MLNLNDITNSLEAIEKHFKNIGVDANIQYHITLHRQHNALRMRREWEDTISTQSIINAIRYSARSQEIADNLIEWVQTRNLLFTKHHASSGEDEMYITFNSQPIDVKENLGRFGVRPITYYIQIEVGIQTYV